MAFEDAILKVNSVSKIYKSQGTPAIDNVTFSVSSGEIFGLIGKENSGKTTLLKMIVGLTKITGGNISVCGYDVETEFKKAIASVGAIVSSPAFYEHLTGYENLEIFASYYSKISKDKIYEIIKYIGLEKQIYNKVSTYSLGMKQRLGFGVALLNSPKLLILDEPTIGLDPNTVVELRNFLLSLVRKQGIAILLSSRSENDIENLCDTIAVLDKGKIIKVSSTKAVKQVIKAQQEVNIAVDYPNFAYGLVKKLFGITPNLSGKNLTFAASEQQIASLLATLEKYHISVFDMVTKTKKFAE